MSVTKLWTDYSVKVGSATYIDGIQSVSISQGLQTALESGDGEVFASFGSLAMGGPTARFSSLNLAAVLNAIGASGTAVGASGITLYSRSKAQGGTNVAAGTGTHVSYLINNGIMVPRRISARSNGNASIDVEVTARQQTTTAPVTYSAAATLPGNTPGVSEVWTVGPVEINGTVLSGIQSIDLDFGVSILAERGDSDVYPTFVTVRSIRPTLRVRTNHIDAISTVTDGTNTLAPDGSFLSENVVVYFRQRAQGGTFTADGTAQHVKVSTGLARVEYQSIDGDPKTIDILITPWLDTGGPTNPITVSTASAIT